MNQADLLETDAPPAPARKEPKAYRPRQLQSYGRIEVGQRVAYERLTLAPTNDSTSLRWMKRDQLTGQIVDVNNTCSVSTLGTVVRIERYELGGIGAVVRIDGGHEKTISIDWYGMSPGDFASLKVTAEAPRQAALRGLAP